MNSLQMAKVPAATTELISLIVTDEEQRPIKMIVCQKDTNTDDVICFATLEDDKSFKYAMFIDPLGKVEADGF